MRARIVLLAVASLATSCGDAPAPAPERDRQPVVTSAAMTREVPVGVRRACRSAARKGTVPVRCPRFLPAGTGAASVLVPRRSVVRPGAAGDDGVRRFRGPRDFYVIEAYARAIRPERHWLTGSGSTRSLESRALTSMEPPRVDRVTVAGRRIEVRQYAPYPTGGVNSGHVVALARTGGTSTYVSVHGQEHRDVAVAMLVDLLAT